MEQYVRTVHRRGSSDGGPGGARYDVNSGSTGVGGSDYERRVRALGCETQGGFLRASNRTRILGYSMRITAFVLATRGQ